MELGKLTAVFDADTRRFDAGVKGVQSKLGIVTGDLRKATAGTSHLTSTLAPATSGLAGMSSALTVAAGASVLVAGAVSGAAAGIYKLATFSQQLGAEIFDLSQKINFSAETLSSLKVAAELSGGSLESLSTSLGIFDRNLEEAKEGGNEMSRVFKALNIDATDNEKALRQAFNGLKNLTSGSQQTALAMKLFGRSGKEVLGIIKETGGNIDDFIDRMREMGLVITSDGAQKADKFGDELTLLRNKLEAVGRQIGQELVPIVSKAADDISVWLKENQGEIVKTAREVAALTSAFISFAKTIADISPVIFTVRIVKQIIDLGGEPESRGPESGSLDLGSLNAPGIAPQIGPLSVFRKPATQGPTTFSPFGTRQGAATAPAIDYGKPGGGGGGGGAKTQKDILQALKNEVISLNTEFRKLDVELFNSANMSELAAEKEKILSAVMSQLSDKNKLAVSGIKDVDQALDAAIGKLSAGTPKATAALQANAKALRDQALAIFKTNEEYRIAGELTKATERLTKEWKQEVDNTRSGLEDYEIAIQGLEAEYRKYNKTLLDGQKEELRTAAVQKKHWELFWELIGNVNSRLEIHARLLETIDGLNDAAAKALTGPGTAIGDLEAISEPPDLSDTTKEILRIRESMRDLANDLTGIFADSIHAGFDKGIKAGLATLAQGLLRIVEEVFLRKLAIGLGNILGDLATGGAAGGGGGIIGNILRDIGGVTPSVTSGIPQTPISEPVVAPRDLESAVSTVTRATTQQTQALSNQIQLTGQQIVQGLTPTRQGGWSGFLNAVIGGAIGGLVGSIGGGGEDWSNEGPVGQRPTTPPVMRYRASGGPVEVGLPYQVHKDELIVPTQNGMVYNQAQLAKMGGQTINNYTINLPPAPAGSYKSPESQRQLAKRVLSALQGST